jgi:gentisate 1,2-dioxygenase
MDLDQLNRELAANHLAGFWTGNVTGFEQNIEPHTTIVPHAWKWSHIYDGLMKAREQVNMEMAERRTLRLSNPGGKGWATPTLHMSVQLVRPGEIAKAHRHSLTALRFIVQGNGACTTVEGERFMMSPGDLILTPNWSWHDHYNGSNEDTIWLDGHDGPLVKALEVVRVEMFDRKQQPVEVSDFASYQYGHARPSTKTMSNFPTLLSNIAGTRRTGRLNHSR